MGQQGVKAGLDTTERRRFSRRVLDDLAAFKEMLDRGMVETGIRRIGAEQELFIIDDKGSPAMMAPQLLERLDHPHFTTELARFNLEFNLDPQAFGGDCLSHMDRELCAHVELARDGAAELGCDVLMTGILPTIERGDLTLDAITPMPRYRLLNDTLKEMRGGAFSLDIKGLDDLRFDHDNILFEACNTSFQIHFQVGPEEFARLYNLAQAVTGPVMALACNSPVLLQHRLWRETRVALFQQSIDNRTLHQSVRGHRPRVSFGQRWVKESILELFREDISRYRMILATRPDEDPMTLVKRGEAPQLSALRLHNGTVYRWNRPCYGVGADGKAHIRIENRVLPAGPTPADEVANAALFFGLILALDDERDDITKRLRFDDAKANFFTAAQHGLRSTFTWLDGHDWKARDLLKQELLPRAREGLLARGLNADDVHHYCDLLEARLETRQTGAQWVLSSLEQMGDAGSRDERFRSVVLATAERQREGRPVHEWSLAAVHETKDWRDSYRYVHQFMATDLFTVRPDDLVDLAASVMDWQHIRHVPVEDDEGRLVGLITMRDMLKVLALRRQAGDVSVSVAEIMHPAPVTLRRDSLSVDALRLMRDRELSCLPVIDDDDKLVGLVTNYDLLRVAAGWMEEQLASLA